jgi:hypothetical protein
MERFFLCLAVWCGLVVLAVWWVGEFVDTVELPNGSLAVWEQLGDRR